MLRNDSRCIWILSCDHSLWMTLEWKPSKASVQLPAGFIQQPMKHSFTALEQSQKMNLCRTPNKITSQNYMATCRIHLCHIPKFGFLWS